MNRESKESLGKMLAMMGRMNAHYTLNESKIFNRKYLNEDNNDTANTTAQPKPSQGLPIDSHMSILENKAGNTELNIIITPLLSGTVNRIRMKFSGIIGGQNEVKDKKYKAPTEWIDIRKPLGKTKKKTETQTTVNEGFAWDDDDDMDLSGFVNDPNANGSTEEKTVNENSIKQWFLTDYVKIIQEILNVPSADSAYDQRYVKDLKDGNMAYAKFKGIVTNEQKAFSETSMEEFTKELYNCAQSEGWDGVVNNIPILNWDSLCYGKGITLRNKRMIQSQFKKNPNGRQAPTDVRSLTTWLKDFGRELIPGQENNGYSYMANRAGVIVNPHAAQKLIAAGFDPNAITDYFGTAMNAAKRKQHTHNIVSQNGYDITQTRLIDPSQPDSMLDRAGIKNNFDAELNDIAVAERDARKKEYDEKLAKAKETMEADSIINTINTPETQAMLSNEALLNWMQNELGFTTITDEFGKPVKMYDVANSDSPVEDFVTNLRNVCRFIVVKNQQTERSTIANISMFLLKAFTHWLGIGNGIVAQLRDSNQNQTASVTYNKFKDILEGTLYPGISSMYTYLSVRVLKLKQEVDDALASDGAQDNASSQSSTQDTSTTNTNTNTNANAVNESINKIEKLLRLF